MGGDCVVFLADRFRHLQSHSPTRRDLGPDEILEGGGGGRGQGRGQTTMAQRRTTEYQIVMPLVASGSRNVVSAPAKPRSPRRISCRLIEILVSAGIHL